MLNLHLTAINSVLSTGAVGGTVWILTKTGKLVKFVATHVEKAKVAFSKIDAIFEHLKLNQPAVQAEQDVVQATFDDSADLRDAKIKAALQLIPQALGVEVANLSNIPVPMIVKYLTDRLPEYNEFITPVSVTAALQMIGGEVQAARAHDGVKMMQEILAYMQETVPTDVGVTQTVVSATVPVQQSAPDTTSDATTAPAVV